MDLHLTARLLAATRIGIGLALFLAPRRVVRGWIGGDADRPGPAAAVRAVGARDVALGVGLLSAIDPDEAPRDFHRWLEAGIVADLADAAATALDGRPDRRAALVIAAASSGVAFGGWLRARLR